MPRAGKSPGGPSRRRAGSESLPGEREAALTEILRVISRSPQDLDASLQAIADAAARLCHADAAQLLLRDGEYLVYGPSAGPESARAAYQPGERLGPISAGEGPAIHAVRDGRTVHTDDPLQYMEEHGTPARNIERLRERYGRLGPRAGLSTPLMRGAEAVGVLQLLRIGESQRFTDAEIALAETFATQAAIAVENARLFDELQARNREQAEALEREQATAEVLRVISRSPENLDASLQAVADTAARLCGADLARVWQRDGDYLTAGPIAPPEGAARLHEPGERLGPINTDIGPGSVAARTGRTVHVEDHRA